jgi:hypothetical protein
MAYVDLNPVRAKLAKTPEGSKFTGAYDRIEARQGKEKIKALGSARRSGAVDAPVRGRLNEAQVDTIRKARQARTRDRWLCRLDNRTGGSKKEPRWRSPVKRGLFPLSVDEYLELLDWTGRQIHAGKPGTIPEHLAPILKRLSLEVGAWVRMVNRFGDLFWRVVGHAEAMVKAARVAGRRWFKGLASSREVFASNSG